MLLAGCQEPVKMVPAAQMEHYRQLERLNEQQAAQITSLQIERDRLTRENEALLLRMQDKDKLLAAQTSLMKDFQKDGIGHNETAVTGEGGSEVIRAKDGVLVRYPGDIAFDAGSDSLTTAGKAAIKKCAAKLKNRDNAIEVRGYSDSQPIKKSKWASNQELSAARALTVANLLKAEGIAAGRVQHVGFGEKSPIMDANGKEDQGRSRRVEIFIADEAGDAKAPATPPTTIKKDKVVPK
jgi:flagellar motor protein MotB